MSDTRKFITWQPVLTDHQAFTFQELARLAALPVIAYVMRMYYEVVPKGASHH